MQNSSESFYKRLSYNLLSVVLIFYILYIAQGILIPLAFSVIFALLLLSPAGFLQKHGLSKSLSALICIILALVIIAAIVTFLSVQLASFRDSWPLLQQKISSNFNSFELWLKTKLHLSKSTLNQYADQALNKALSSSGNVVGSVAATASTAVLNIVLIIIFTFLFLIYRGTVIRFFSRAFHSNHQENIVIVIDKIHKVARDYISGLIIEMLIVAVMNAIGFYMVGVQYIWFLAVFAAVLNVIPYVGIAVALTVTVLITFAGSNAQQVWSIIIVMVIVHLIDSNYIMAKVVGSKVKLNSIISLLAVIVGGSMWGISGMFLAIPLIAMLKVLFDNIESLNHWGILLGEEESTAKKKGFLRFWHKKEKAKPAEKQAQQEVEKSK